MALQHATRRGVSYLEVLIAAGIALTGIMGAVALLPVAIVNMQKGVVVDTMACIGPSALDTAPSLGVNQRSNWLVYSLPSRNWDLSVDAPGAFPNGETGKILPFSDTGPWASYCFDPRFAAESASVVPPLTAIAGTFDPRYFPYKPKTNANDARMLRTTLRREPNSNFYTPLAIAPARLLFKVSDDLIFNKTEDNLGPKPALQDYILGTAGATPQRRNYMADYEYMITMTPSLRGVPVDASGMSFSRAVPGPVAEQVPLERPTEYTMSAVVFHKRQVAFDAYLAPDVKEPEAERVVDVFFYGSGYKGGDIAIRGRMPTSSAMPNELEVHEGDWVMLSGNMYSLDAQRKFLGPRFAWYRVAAVGMDTYEPSPATGFYYRDLTLDGPDWPASTTTPPALPNNLIAMDETQMTIVSGVVGVFSTRVNVTD